MHDIPLESARQRAMRIWRNSRILADKQPTTDKEKPLPYRYVRLRREIMSVFNSKNQEVVEQYAIALNQQYKRLLREKLRRLENMEQNDE